VARVSQLSLSYSLADQCFARTQSLGILNLSVQMLQFLARRPEIEKLNVLSNSSLSDRLQLPPEIPVSLHDSALRNMAGRIVWDQWGAYAQGKRLGNKWLFLPKGYASFMRPCPVNLATCVADASYEYYKRVYPKKVTFFRKWYFDFCVRGTIKYSKIIFTISDFTAAEVIRIAHDYGIAPPRVQMIGIGFTRPEHLQVEKKPRIVVFAGWWPHKRTDLAIQYMARWCDRTGYKGTVEWIGRFPTGVRPPELPGWIVHSRLPDADFKRLKAEAQALVYFSDYEGFGMPPVEATIVGTCPVYSDLPATREVMAGAGCFFDNRSYDSFEKALNRAMTVPPETIETWASELLRRHNWPDVVNRVIKGLSESEKE
jgi:hypothetical protein